jgi:menaquinone-dependent protoporphyrinogen IX oxidase
MRIEYLHASKFGNGAKVAAEFKRVMATKGVDVEVHHIKQVKPAVLSPADLYVFSSPGRFGKPIRSMRRFLDEVTLPTGTRYALLTTEVAPKPNKKTGQVPTHDELDKWQRVRPLMHEVLASKGLVSVREDTIFVTGLRGPLEDGWLSKVNDFADRLPTQGDSRAATMESDTQSPDLRSAKTNALVEADAGCRLPGRAGAVRQL